MIKDILITCFEGGSNYWIDSIKVISGYKGDIYDAIINGHEIEIMVEGKRFILTKKTFISGCQNYANNTEYQVGAAHIFFNEDFDAEIADVILQYSLFNEIVYG